MDFTAFQDVECVYPMSGQYGDAQRAMYYILLLFVIIFRRQDWLTAGAAAFCLTFAGSAAVHSMIMVSTSSLGRPSLPDGVVSLSNGTAVMVSTVTQDLDAHATLAIVGTAFIIAVPMSLWSSQLRYSGTRPVLALWITLISIGMVCNISILYGAAHSSNGPPKQFRFCTPGYNDSLPYNANPNYSLNDSWNSTLWSYFSTSTTASCFYPCLNAKSLLRRDSDATVIIGADPDDADGFSPSQMMDFRNNPLSQLFSTCLPLSVFLNLMVFIFRLRGHRATKEPELNADLDVMLTRKEWRIIIRNLVIWFVNVYSIFLTPLICLVFLMWVEQLIHNDLQSEGLRMVGQWAPLLGAGFVFMAAVVGKYWPPLEGSWRRFRERRNLVRRGLLDEKVLESWRHVRHTPKHPSAWSRSAMVVSQGDHEC